MRTAGALILVVHLVGACGVRADARSDDLKMDKPSGEDVVTNRLDQKPKISSKTAIRLLGKGVEVRVRIDDDTPVGRDFLASLPLTLTVKDHNGTEKIAMLPRKLKTRGAPAGMKPAVGDFAYYAPWGNLAIFYKDFTYSEGLVALGRVEAGLDELARLESEMKVTIELVDE